MTAFSTTTKWALRWLTGANPGSDVDAGFQALAEDLDPKLTPYDEGLLASRPVSTSGTPGKKGRFYRATDDTTGGAQGTLYYDYGTGWAVLPALGALAKQAAPGVTSVGTLARRVLAPDLSAVSSYTFSGLDGDNDRQYLLGLSGVLAIGAADRSVTVKPNASTGWFDSKYREDWWDSGMQTVQGENRGAGNGWLLGLGSAFGTYGANHILAEMQIEAKRRTGTPRVAKASWSASPDAATERHLIGQAGGKWEDMTTNITSLAVNFGGGTFTGDIWLERVFA